MNWAEKLEEQRDHTVAIFDRMTLPEYMTGEDVFQDVMLLILEKGRESEVEGAGFVVKVGREIASNAMRAERGEEHWKDGKRKVRDFIGMDKTEDMVDYFAPDHEAGMLCREIFSKLPPESANILFMRYIEGYQVQEMGEKSVMSRKIKKCLEEAEEIVNEGL